MEPQANDTPGPVDNPTEVVLENLDRLFVGVVTEEDASGSLRLMGPPAQSFPMQKSGEILLNGRIENGLFVLERVRRVALAGTLLSESLTPEQQAADPIGVFSLNGPLDSPRLEQTGEGVVDPLSIQLHYRALTFAGIRSGKTTLNEAGDAMFPPTVRMFGRIEWRQVGAATETSVPLTLKLSFTNDAETNRRIELENQVASILVEREITIDFIWAASAPFEEAEEYAGGDGGALPFQPPLLAAVMLLAPCGPSALPCSQPRQELLLRQLPLRFVNLATTDPQQAATIAARCYEQVQGACEVWRQKAILRMLAPMVIAQGVRRIPLVPAAANLVNQFQNFVEDNGAMYEALVQIANLQSVTQIDVYIVTKVFSAGVRLAGGALTYDAGQASAAIFLDRTALEGDAGAGIPANQYVLAHELGHVLGLQHRGEPLVLPDGAELIEGSAASIMEPSGDQPSNPANSTQNCQIFADADVGVVGTAGNVLLNPLAKVIKPLRRGCLKIPS